MTYIEAATIALRSAQRDGMVRYVYLADAPATADKEEEWRVSIVMPDTKKVAVIFGTMRFTPPKPEA